MFSPSSNTLLNKHLPQASLGPCQSPISLTGVVFLTGTAMLGPQKPELRVGGRGELLCYMERLSPLSENKVPP